MNSGKQTRSPGANCYRRTLVLTSALAGLSFLVAGSPFEALASSLTVAKSENIAPPVTKLDTTDIVSPAAAWSYYGGGTTHTTGISLANTASPEIKALARALLGNRNVSNPSDATAFTQNVFDYVRNNINTEFRYGLSKGGRGALIDQSGTPYDQADLMVALLAQGGISASYAVGEVTVTPAQFGAWTGLVNNLTDSSQTFAVDGHAACQLLADGGIPASVAGASSCANVSGPLTGNIVMSHIWVVVNGVAYDPSYKAYTLRTGIDIPNAMGCGTQSASTCGSNLSAAGMSGATQGTTSGGIPYIDSYNAPNAQTTSTTQKSNLANYILTQNINGQGVAANVWDVLGGRKLNPQTLAQAPLAYTQRTTWAAIPDQFRTKLNANIGSICGSFFADEIAGRALIYKALYLTPAVYTVDGNPTSSLSYTAAEACSSVAAPYAQIYVDHPYAANGGAYADEVVNFKPVDPPSDETGFYRPTDSNALYFEGGYGVTPQTLNVSAGNSTHPNDFPEQNYLSNGTYTIVHEFGQGGEGSAKQMSDLAAVTPQNRDMCALVTSSNNPVDRSCLYEEQGTVAATFQTMRTLTDRLVDGVAKTVTTRHHDVGIVYGGRQQGLSIMSLQESLSVAPQSGLAQDQQSGFDMQSLVLGEAEARANAVDGAEGISAARSFFGFGMGSAGPNTLARVYDIAPSQMAGYLASIPTQASVTNSDGSKTYGYYCINYLDGNGNAMYAPGCWRQLALQDVANQGYSTLITQGAGGELFYSGSNQRALTMWEYVKGGASVGDTLATSLKSTEVRNEAALRRKSLSVAPSSGEVKVKAEADIVTGAGDFPYSLPFIRTFTPSNLETSRYASTTYYSGPGASQTNTSYVAVTSGPDAEYHDRLGGGWMHNYEVINANSIDLSYQLGSEDAYLATEMIANLQVIKDLGVSSTLPSKLGSLYALNNMSRTLGGSNNFNTSIVRIGTDSVVFHKTFDGKWFAPQSPTAQLATTVNATSTYTSADGEVISFSPYRYDQIPIQPNATYGDTTPQPPAGPLSGYTSNVKYLKADSWSFPNGIRLTFNYTGTSLSSGANLYNCNGGANNTYQYTGQYGYLLSSVTNNLGHTLTFQHQLAWTRQASPNNCGQQSIDNYAYVLTSVSDETGRTVTFSPSGGSGATSNTFTVTDNAGNVTTYQYTAGADSPDPATIVRTNYQLRRWFTPKDSTHPYQSIAYDDLFRAATITDRNGHVTTYYPGGMFGSELWKRTETVDGAGNVSLDVFDDKNGDIYSRTPLGNVTTKVFDNMSRPLRTVLPEGNALEQIYDVRGNPLRTCKIAKSRAGQSCDPNQDIVTYTSYVEGPTAFPCANNVVCNKEASETDALNNVTNYSWDSTTGNLTQILKPAVFSANDNSNIRPEIDASYTTYNGISFLTGKTDKIDGTHSTTTTYGYDSSNHYALQSVVVDSGGLSLRTCLKYDALGNLIYKTDPKAGLAVCQ
jgi:hypothetical protein